MKSAIRVSFGKVAMAMSLMTLFLAGGEALGQVAGGAPLTPEPAQTVPDSRLPMSVQMRATPVGDGVVSLDVIVQVNRTLDGPVWLRLELDQQGVLLQGLPEEELGTLPVGAAVTRTFVVALNSGVARAHAVSAGPAMGAAAWASWPQVAPLPAVVPDMQPVAPMKLYGIPIHKAVPLQ